MKRRKYKFREISHALNHDLLKDFGNVSPQTKAEIVRVATFDFLQPSLTLTTSDEAAFYLQVSMLSFVADYLAIYESNAESVELKRQQLVAIHWCFVLSAYLIKDPTAPIEGIDTGFFQKFEGAPAHKIASAYLTLLTEPMKELLRSPELGTGNSKQQSDMREDLKARIDKYEFLAKSLESNINQPSASDFTSAILTTHSGTWFIRPGFCFPIPQYLLLKEEKEKTPRWYYNVSGDKTFGMPYNLAGVSSSILPDNLSIFGRNNI